ncbi:MAG: TetR/AcrR family transcriptional regulator [Microbacteriaceae bacterium]|nr:TetR/AcrR family transcriptional regulator [Microbacteriaceae bacterium]MCL2793787.1 TetR/AcrR family transcriptional regulator [Microbacteriaceae bacterium]
MTATDPGPLPARRRADVERNERALLEAAAAVFAQSGRHATVRDVAEAAGVGMGTLYRHFPTRGDLVIAVYRHQIEVCAAAGPELLRAEPSPLEATRKWMLLFADFLGAKHGMVTVMRGDPQGLATLHALFLERLAPVLTALLDAGRAVGEVASDATAYELMRAVGDLCAFAPDDPDYDVRRVIALLVRGLATTG